MASRRMRTDSSPTADRVTHADVSRRMLSRAKATQLDKANSHLVQAYTALITCMPPAVAVAIATQVIEDLAAASVKKSD